ncbi:MAG: bifunctional folylpolyglutamate synthase/dihydrofolate synthase [Lachnoclostridium sp.]|nr:bifunctional folylpolyglutamate synthase/dihydrofolate synthase [Lachnospira sp.]MCM1247446.1 bifunctional folylpolyglutamate synthase/dihydrofolate synthase [Lachnoclostridium sp.]MCM1536194.1 bifunctional folylpolyglutamate synthase/dihydrofolate synthase [Clostridium sp.]
MKDKEIRTFEEAVAYLNDVPYFTSKNTMEDTKAFLKRLGCPDRQMKIIHVAGTNGKGSVCAYLCSILEEAGYRVCMFTSPHLVDIRERFYLEGHMVEKEDFHKAFLRIYEALKDKEEYHPTFFEYLFFMAMILFAEEKPDYCILETGLGGRLDATNSVGKKELSVITRISLDHVQYLGDTISLIAEEKAGIMQAHAPLVYADVEEDASEVFRRKGEKIGVSLYPVSKKDYTFLDFKNKSIDFSLHTKYYGYIRLHLNTMARYQTENVSLAVRAVEVLDKGRTISADAIERGVEKCRWQGRMEEILPEVYVDGAHNEDGVRAFLDTVREDGVVGKRTLLFGVCSDKACEIMMERVVQSGLFEKLALAPINNRRAASLEDMAAWAARFPLCKCVLYENVTTAFQKLLDEQMPGERIYIAGSLYLVGEIKESLGYD